MSDPPIARVNVGAYDSPFSGVGIEFDPLDTRPDRYGMTLHESGFLAGNRDWNFPSVFSPFWRLYHNGARGHCVLFGERIVELTPDAIMLIPPHRLFHCLGANPVPTLWLAFSFTRALDPAIEAPILLRPSETELCLIRDLRALILDDLNHAPTDAIRRHSLAILHVILARTELRWSPPLPDSLARLLDHLESHLADRLPVPHLARLAGMSVSGLNRSFRRHLHSSVARHITETRVREAARRLLHTGDTIDEIALATGFPNRAYFSRVFRNVTGTPPATFRRARPGGL